jgi:hypothetical protein
MRLDHSTTQKHGATSQKTKSSETAQSSQSLTLPKINSDLTKLSPIRIFKRIKPGTPPYWQSLFIHVATWDMLFGNVASIWCITPDFIKICPSVLKLKHTGGEKQTIPRMCLLFTASSAKRAQEPIIAPWRWKQTRQLEGYTATSKWRRRKTRKCYRDTVVLWHVTPCRMESVIATLWSCGTWRRVGWKNCTDVAENHADGSRRIQSVHCCQTIRGHILEKNNLQRHHLEKRVIYQDWMSLCWILKLGNKDNHQYNKKYWVLKGPWE